MSSGVVHYVHGYGAGPVGYKSVRFKEIILKCGWRYEALDYQSMDDAGERATLLLNHLKNEQEPVILVGSSMGGWVASHVASKREVRGLFLLCPAFELDRYPSARPPVQLPGDCIEIVHGMNDDVVPLDASLRAAKAWNCRLHVFPDNHVLHQSTVAIGELLSLFLTIHIDNQLTENNKQSSDR